MKKISLLPLCAIFACFFAPVSFSQDGDFSLDGNTGSNTGSDSGLINGSTGSDADLFGDGSVADAPSDSKSTIVKQKPKTTVASPPTKQPTTATLPIDVTIKNPASPFSPVAASAPPPLPVASQAAPISSAPLVGDGSLAPVKLNPGRVANEFGGAPPLPGTRRVMAAGEAPEFYDVEEGDTMFDVCSQLIDDGNYWPKLWSLNPDVKNPHFIFPGMKLAFYSGDDENPPFLEVVADDEVVPVEKGDIKEAELVSEPIQSLGNEGGSVKVVHGIEEQSAVSVVGPSDIGSEGDPLDGFIFSGRPWSSDDLSIAIPAFFFAEEREPLGQIVGGVNGEGMAGDNAKILVSPSASLAAGTYTVLRPVGLVSSLRSGEKVGYRYEFEGNVRLTRRTQGGLMEGFVFDGFGGVKSGDIVVNFLATRRTINGVSTVGAPGMASSSVIGFQDAGMESGAKGDLVFLEKKGLSVGNYYVIFKTETNRLLHHQSNQDARTDAGPAAIARIIEVSGEAAIGYIVVGTSEVRVGDSLTLQ